MNRQAMQRVAGAGGDVSSYFPNESQLPVGRIRQQRCHQIFEGDDPDLQLHQLGV